ncbi:unnamed protein product [Prunus brigantina]
MVQLPICRPLDFNLDDSAKLRKLVRPTRNDPNRFPKFIFRMMMSHLENKDSDAGGEDIGTSICQEEQSEVDVMDLDEDPELWPEELYREEQEKMRKGLERLASQMGKRVDEIWR